MTTPPAPDAFTTAKIPPPEPGTDTHSPSTASSPGGVPADRVAWWGTAIGAPIGLTWLWTEVSPWVAVAAAVGLVLLLWWVIARRRARGRRGLRLSLSRTTNHRGTGHRSGMLPRWARGTGGSGSRLWPRHRSAGGGSGRWFGGRAGNSPRTGMGRSGGTRSGAGFRGIGRRLTGSGGGSRSGAGQGRSGAKGILPSFRGRSRTSGGSAGTGGSPGSRGGVVGRLFRGGGSRSGSRGGSGPAGSGRFGRGGSSGRGMSFPKFGSRTGGAGRMSGGSGRRGAGGGAGGARGAGLRSRFASLGHRGGGSNPGGVRARLARVLGRRPRAAGTAVPRASRAARVAGTQLARMLHPPSPRRGVSRWGRRLRWVRNNLNRVVPTPTQGRRSSSGMRARRRRTQQRRTQPWQQPTPATPTPAPVPGSTPVPSVGGDGTVPPVPVPTVTPTEFLSTDDAGFPTNVPHTPVGDLAVDDGGFPTNPVPPTLPPGLDKPAPHEGNDLMSAPSTATAGQGVEHYTRMIDQSTPATKIRTAGIAADAARRSALEFQQQADTLRTQALGLQGKEGMEDAVVRLLAEAARAEETAIERHAMAAGYDQWAADMAAANHAVAAS